MEISANVVSANDSHQVTVRAGSSTQSLAIAPKANGRGSSVNGGELLMLALATCYCNDLYREAEHLGIALDGVEVEAVADFTGIGAAATKIRYRARVSSPAATEEIDRLLRETDAVAEIHNTIRAGAPVERVDD